MLQSENFYFPERRVQRAGAVISILLSAVLLVSTIIYFTAVTNESTSMCVLAWYWFSHVCLLGWLGHQAMQGEQRFLGQLLLHKSWV